MSIICRTCSETKSRFFNIFNHYENGKLSAEILHECTSLEIENGDLLPLFICSECLDKLVVAWCFRTMAIETDSKLRKVFCKQPSLVDKKHECKDYDATVIKEESNVKSEIQDPLNIENENVSDIRSNEVTLENTNLLTENHETNLLKSPLSDCNGKEMLCPAVDIKQEPDLNIQISDLQQLQYEQENNIIRNDQNRGSSTVNKEKSKSLLKCKTKNVDSICNSAFSEGGINDHILPIEAQLMKDSGNAQVISELALPTSNYVQLAIIPTLSTPFYIFNGVNEAEKTNNIETVKENVQKEVTATQQDSLEPNDCKSKADDLTKVLSEKDNTNEPATIISSEEYKKLTVVERRKLTVHCKLCNKNFKYRYYSEVHVRKHKGDLPHVCHVCGKSFITTSQLKEHSTVHSDVRPFACDICGKSFKMLPVLQNHRTTHSDDRPYKCNVCNVSFKLESYLKAHMKIHTNKKDYICEVCGKTFFDYRYLQSHLKFQHEVKNFLCTLCGKAYPTNSRLKWHLKYTHTNERPYACPYCDKRFKGKNVMESHARIHTGEKPHSCKMCGRKFRQIVALRTHMRTHTGEAPYACKKCPSRFKYTQDLKKHMKVHDE